MYQRLTKNLKKIVCPNATSGLTDVSHGKFDLIRHKKFDLRFFASTIATALVIRRNTEVTKQ